ncbi:calcium-binding protein [Mesorhizobium sp. IMUNJ 23232]|uniref:calcium-binding protein n=1 Tax=Mesorhizobium sp. IMUNJ 23232 TaxID=3376064 RepID=UPI0037A9A0D7
MTWQYPHSRSWDLGIVVLDEPGESVVVAKQVSIATFSSNYFTIDARSSGGQIVVAGTVAGTSPIGVGFQAGDSKFRISIEDTGQVRAIEGPAIRFDTNGHIVNHGLVAGGSSAISMDHALSIASSITNSGTIEADQVGIFYRTAGGTLTTLNTGIISGGLMSYSSQGTKDIDLLTNSGRMIGDVFLGGGNDVYDGRLGSVDSVVDGEDGDDRLYAGDGNATLIGGYGQDILMGGIGADYLQGGTGWDVASYESATAGVIVSLSNQSINTGDAEGDTLVLIEGLIGSRFDDTLEGGEFARRYFALDGGAGNDTLHGSGAADTLIGGAGADILDGGPGVAGFGDSDTASYANAQTGVILSLANPSINSGDAKGDTFIDIENFLGSRHGDTLNGDNAGNSLDGQDGNDNLKGYSGNDGLAGGKGNDNFIFNTKLDQTYNVDSISDFKSVDDAIWLDNAVFSALTATGILAASAFKDTANGAKDADDRIIYNSDTGFLYYDADGSGAAFISVKFARLQDDPVLTAADIVVI